VAPEYLKLVRHPIAAGKETGAVLEKVQAPLLPASAPTVAVCTSDGLDYDILMSLLENYRPRLILDFRTVPRFDFGALNRDKALNIFEDIGATYRDFGRSQAQSIDSSRLITDALAHATLGDVARNDSLLLLIDAGANFEKVGMSAIQTLRERSNTTWELLLFGPIVPVDQSRDAVFISHANPEDNEFTFWLQTQLTRAGYRTWSDLTDLKAGEVFWDSIEDVIRNKAARVIAVISRRSMVKPSVLDEISLAVSIERTRMLPGFVIPLRVDDYPFSEMRANIARKNIVDFSTGWAAGLSRLMTTLAADKVPKSRQAEGLSLAQWWTQQRPATHSIVTKQELLMSNTFRVNETPARIYSYSGTPECANNHCLVPFRGLWLSFRSPEELHAAQISGINRESTISAPELFSGNSSLTNAYSFLARQKLFHRLLNRQWEVFLLSRGLRLYAETGIYPTPYIPDGLIANNTTYFLDQDGVRRRRILVGQSIKRSLYWHLAPAGYFSTSPTGTALHLKIRILFSEDGQARWPSVERMKTTRRSFCKNWWNDRWRSLQCSFMSWISEGNTRVLLYAGHGGALAIDVVPQTYASPLSIDEALALGDDEKDINGGDGSELDADIDEMTESELGSEGDSELEQGSPS
jgi:hypothetical protein